MKKIFESPKLELCEFVVAARLNGSGLGTGHDHGQGTACSMTSSMGRSSCDETSNRNSSPPPRNC